jgi:type II secretory pathway pseudopilin PulG
MKNIFNKKNKSLNQLGFSVIEVLVACMIMSVVTLALMSAASKGIELSGKALKQVQAGLLAEEGAEAVKSIRDNGWTTISSFNVETDYYLTFDTNSNIWSLSETPTSLVDGIFTRKVVFSEVYRDNNNDDISTTGTLDDGIKKVSVLVSWPHQGGVVSRNIIFYLANIF